MDGPCEGQNDYLGERKQPTAIELTWTTSGCLPKGRSRRLCASRVLAGSGSGIFSTITQWDRAPDTPVQRPGDSNRSGARITSVPRRRKARSGRASPSRSRRVPPARCDGLCRRLLQWSLPDQPGDVPRPAISRAVQPEALSPFCPLGLEDSSFPVAVMRSMLTNPAGTAVECARGRATAS